MRTRFSFSLWARLAAALCILSTLVPSHSARAKEIASASYALSSQLLPNILAKEICSCLYVVNAIHLGRRSGLNRCLARANLPFDRVVLDQLLSFDLSQFNSVHVYPTLFARGLGARPAQADFNALHPQFGCTLRH